MSGPPPPKPGGGLSLYADLLDPPGDSTASISRGPQLSQQALDALKEQEDGAAAGAAKKADASLRFQPIPNIRRPQQKTQKPKAGFPKAAAVVPGSGIGNPAAAATGAPAPPLVKSTLADWTNTEEDDFMFDDRRPRNKKKKKKHNAPVETDWNEIYDPSRPTNVDEYLRSDERILEVREWKALLYRHRRPADRKRQSSWDSEEDEEQHRPMGNQFAPPSAYSFAPPPPSPPRAAPAPLPDDKTGDDAYARRLALSQGIPPPPPPPTEPSHTGSEVQSPVPPPPPPEPDNATISRAPVRYSQPEPTETMAMDDDVPENQAENEEEDEDEDAPRSNRPGQKGFAARLMSKYGWSKGQGLGAEGTGILAPLRVQVEKRKKNENGGWAEPGGRGKIIQPKANPNNNNTASSTLESSSAGQGGKFGAMSNVIVLRHMLDNIEDAQQEMEDGLGQEIGEECGDKYGRVERIYIDTAPQGSKSVYIKFVDTVSALRAVNALDGRVFAGSSIEPRFYDLETFEKGVYE
ncbi:hypothetical protein PFICI_06766 [Pestalotiopsis fici W106-1]|uniref:G-patch domain-containing protein n=1 Tax=Pestalotiopsis fici (strain W106-1 / CGMCC3.15140) TaxID=1229662 RepID=W3X6X1_PESFW|nr:uncharacterized protein PFICI_06766 [Pestalotiopsis fici W106-1]ETS81764.1 hypothetical protein PFICI_06766 [Pestalotiopsis fici W106-1]